MFLYAINKSLLINLPNLRITVYFSFNQFVYHEPQRCIGNLPFTTECKSKFPISRPLTSVSMCNKQTSINEML